MHDVKPVLLSFVILVIMVSNSYGADTDREVANIIAMAIDGKSIEKLLKSNDIIEVMTGMKYMETAKLLRKSYLDELKSEILTSKIALFESAKNVGNAADIMSRVLDGKSLNELLRSPDIIDALKGFNYLNRASDLDKKTTKAKNGELVRIISFNGELTQKYTWLWNDYSSGKAVPITLNNYKTVKIEKNGKLFVFRKKGDLFEKIEEPKLEVASMSDRKSSNIFPDYSLLLKGDNEVRITNPNDFKVTVGLRSGVLGKNFVVASNGIASVSVPDGDYQIYYIYANNPTALYKGDGFSLNGNGTNITILKYRIKRIK